MTKVVVVSVNGTFTEAESKEKIGVWDPMPLCPL